MADFVKKGQPINPQWANDVASALRSRRSGSKKNKTIFLGGGSSNTCAFGSIVTTIDAKFIRGGVIYCGDQNFTVPNFEIDLETTGTKLIYFEIECEVNRDDDNEILLPAVKTSTWTPAWENTSDDEYPDNTNPVVATGLGTIIVPIASLTTASGRLSAFNPVGCGPITISHCSGSLTHTRG